MFGRVLHYTIDAILISTVLAGIRRSTGLTPKRSKIGTEATGFLESYLDIGERVFDMSVVVLSTSGWFEKRR